MGKEIKEFIKVFKKFVLLFGKTKLGCCRWFD